MDDRRLGVLSGLAAYSLWGLFPLYFPLLEPAGGREIVAHRVRWARGGGGRGAPPGGEAEPTTETPTHPTKK